MRTTATAGRYFVPVILILYGLLSSCFTQKEVVFKEVSSIRPVMSADSMRVSMDIGLFNPNNWGLTLRAAEIDVLIDGKKTGRGTLNEPVRMKANQDAAIPCTLHCKNEDLLKLLPSGLEVLLGSREILLSAKGRLRVRKFIIGKTYPVELRQKVDSRFMKNFLQ